MASRKRKIVIHRRAFMLFCTFAICGTAFMLIKNLQSEQLYKTVILDAGHGGDDPGCMYGEISEKDINLKIANELKTILETNGYTVKMVRKNDENISALERAKLANGINADIYISIHQNAADDIPSASGIETCYSSNKRNSKTLASEIQKSLMVRTGAKDRSIQKRDDLIVTRETKMPSVLVECGFLSNEAERKLLSTSAYQKRIAAAIYDGILEYYK